MAARPLLLFVDDEASILDGMRRSFAREPFECLFATTQDEALMHLEQRPIDVIVCDERFPGGQSGWELLTTVRTTWPRIMRIMLTGAASMGSTVASINHGQVFRFLLKPCPHELLVTDIHQALEQQALHDGLRRALRHLRRVNDTIARVAREHPAEYQAAARVIDSAAAGPEPVSAVDLQVAITENLDAKSES